MDGRINKIAYIILHYKAIDDTVRCVESIRKINKEAGIVLIDNASPDGSGSMLRDKYDHDPNIHLIINNENLGFSRANNIGCLYARDNWNPDFYIVANNDITFPEPNFEDTIGALFDKHHFAILGPDIINTRANVHQSPRQKGVPTLFRSRITVILNEICYGLFPITYPLLKHWYHDLRENPSNVPYWDKEQTGVLLSGSCVIFSKDYLTSREKPFDPETFFFSEEAIFTNWCIKNNKTILYSPDIRVMHNESASTYLEKDARNRIKFQMRNIIDSTKIYIRELKKDR